MTKSEYIEYVEKGKIKEVLNSVKVKADDVAFIPAGRIHAIRKGVFLAEIQQTSDLTYRIYDWDRKDLDGTYRELHTDLAIDVVDLKQHSNYLTDYKTLRNSFSEIISNTFFTVNFSEFSGKLTRDYSKIDSFIILIIISGELKLFYQDTSMTVTKGETILIPTVLEQVVYEGLSNTKMLEVYI